uniref:protein-tyrosine-phosphatase n=1 Tax=Sinocyclocheilus grahami TaxID=75366 RepID=A0A672LEB2_SINGR
MGLKTLGGCLSTASTTNTSSSNSTVSDCRTGLLRPLGCASCSGEAGGFESPAAFRKKLVGGCLPCTPLSSSAPLRALQSCVSGCNPKASQTGSSTCSYCSSDPIVVTFNPHRGNPPNMGRNIDAHTMGGYQPDDDDYSVRTIWPEELAKKMTRSKTHGSGGNPVILDCRNLMEFTRSQLTDQAGRRRLQQGKMAVLDFIGSGNSGDQGRDSLKRTLIKPKLKQREREGGHTLPSAQSLHLVLNSLNREQDEENGRGKVANVQVHSRLSDIFIMCFFDHSTIQKDEHNLFTLPSVMTPDMENAVISPILPFLFLGNERDAQDLDLLLRLNIGFVVNITTHLPLYHLDTGLVRYKRLPATDNSKQNLRQYFEEVFEFIEEAHQCGRGVLVHCQAGVSRSATIVIAYLMKHTLMTMTDAYKYVRGRRPIVSPNLNFMGQLLEFERDLNSGVTPRILTPKLSGLETQV